MSASERLLESVCAHCERAFPLWREREPVLRWELDPQHRHGCRSTCAPDTFHMATPPSQSAKTGVDEYLHTRNIVRSFDTDLSRN